MLRKILLAVCVAVGVSVATAEEFTREDSIQWAVIYQLENYPESELCDVYKNFMQDYFGPGHILKDTKAAKAYLMQELEETERFDGPLYESTGYHGNFMRVNLSVLKDGKVPFDTFFKAFVKSVKGIKPPRPEVWKEEWNTIDQAIQDLGHPFENETADRREIEDKFNRNEFVMHHSDAFNKSSNFHYRIISREIFEKEIKPLLGND